MTAALVKAGIGTGAQCDSKTKLAWLTWGIPDWSC